MANADTWIGILGVAISIITAFVTYKQTIGAKKERVRLANESLIEVISKRMVLEEFVPVPSEVALLVAGRARESKVGVQDLYDFPTLSGVLYKRIAENDYLTAEKRKMLVKTLTSELETFEKESDDEQDGPDDAPKSRAAVLGLFGFLASAFGTLFVAVVLATVDSDSFGSSRSMLSLVTLVFLTSALAILLLFGTIKAREKLQGETPPLSPQQAYAHFESKVENLLRKSRVKYTRPSLKDAAYDFAVVAKDGVHLIEVKNWRKEQGPKSANLIRWISSRLITAVESKKAVSAIIVTPESVEVPHLPAKVVTMGFGEFEKTVRSWR